MTIAEAIAKGMRDDGYSSIGWGDNRLVDYVADLSQRSHPLNRMAAGMSAMERSPLFEKFYRRSMDAIGRERRVRCFRLIES